MDKEFRITDKADLGSKIICNNCRNPLNVTPVFCIQKENSVKDICGRCNHMLNHHTEGNILRQHTYEKFAQFLTYPCANKSSGCDAILTWNQVLDHELVCNFQTMHCPLSYKELFPGKSCNWTGNAENLNPHIEQCHKESIINPPKFDWVEQTENNHIFFTQVGERLVTVVIKHDTESKFLCLLMVNGNDTDSQCFRYQLELFNEKRDNSIILRNSRLQPLGCMMMNLKNPERMLQVDIGMIKALLQHTRVIFGRFGIVKKNKKEILQITGIKSNDEENVPHSSHMVTKEKPLPIDENMLQELECPVCNEYMIPPIYICQAGHSICNDCKSKVANCPNCRSSFAGSRNFTLEKLTTRVRYPCRNREIGCSYVTTSDKIRNHDDQCELSETSCLLRCGHKCIRPSMYNHVAGVHSDVLLDLNALNIRDVSVKRESFYVLYFSGDLFRFSIKGSAFNPYKFNVQHLGMVDDNDPTYRYQLQIMDKSRYTLNISLTNICQRLTDVPNKAHATAVTVPWEMLKPLVYDSQYFCYKITMSKI